MKVTLIKLIIFSSVIIVLMFVGDRFLDTQMKLSQNHESRVWSEIESGKINADIIINGSSYAATHIDPIIIKQKTSLNTYNIGLMGHNFYLEYMRYMFYLKHNHKPKIILLSLDYESLQKRKDLFNVQYLLPYIKDSIIAEACKHYEGISKYDYIIPILKYAGRAPLVFQLIKQVLSPQIKQDSNWHNGFFAQNTVWGKAVDQRLDSLKPYKIIPDSLSINCFDKFLSECKAQNIKVVFIRTPIHALAKEKIINRSSIDSLYLHYANKYQLNYLNYLDDSLSLHKSNFVNATHLNLRSAQIITNQIINDIQPLLKKNKLD